MCNLFICKKSIVRFMESPLPHLRMHWDHEPADRAAASWTAPVLWRFRLARLHRQSARGLAHSKTWRGFQRFMESLLGLAVVHWDHDVQFRVLLARDRLEAAGGQSAGNELAQQRNLALLQQRDG